LTWLECSNCNTYVHTYKPLPHQRAVHEDTHHIIGNFGGYGTGKTTTSREEILKHILITPNANILVGANVQSQYEQTIKRELEMDLPAAFVKDYSAQKQHMDFINGARIIWRPFDDADKIRSYTISMAVILEASEVKAEAFVQLKTRLRNLSATIPETDAQGNIVYITIKGIEVPKVKYDWRKLISESNPDSGWIRSEVLLRAHRIHQYETHFDYLQDPERIDPDTSAHVAASTVNAYLPPGFLDQLARTNPEWWVARYLKGSFQYSEGLVYPSATAQVVPVFEIPRHWKRIVAFDYGISDLAAFVFGAIDEIKGIVYIYKVVTARDRNIEQLAKMYQIASADIPSGGLYCSPIIDPKSGPKRDYHLKTLSEQFLDYGINFKAGQINLDARIYRLNTYIESGKLKIMENCTHLIEEFGDYRWPERNLSDANKKINKPVDKNNHTINCVEWIVMELPRDPRHLLLEVYGQGGRRIDISREEEELSAPIPWQFAEEEQDSGRDNKWW
jgi:phage terminase large subunit